jgi:O-antigen/teichoic acid export membrane protein
LNFIKKLVSARATSLLGEKIVKLGTSAVLTVFVARMLGATELGIYSIVMAWSAFLVPLTSMGLNNLVVRQMIKLESGHHAMTMLYTAVTVRLVFGLVGGAIMVMIFYWLNPSLFSGHLNYAIPLLFVLQAFFGFLLFEFYLNYQGTFRTTAYTKSIISILSFTLKLILLYQGFGIASLLLITAFEFLVVGLAQYLIYNQKHRPFKNEDARWSLYHPKHFNFAHFKELLQRSSWLWLSGIVSVIYLKIDIVMLGAMAGTEQAGIYAAASRLSELWYVFPATLAVRYYPDMLKAYEKDWNSYLLKLRRFAKLFFGAALGIAVIMSLTADWIVILLFGEAFSAAVTVLQIHIWSGCFIFVRYLISQHLVITEQEPLSLFSHGMGALLNVGLNLWLIPQYGIVGAAWATLISYAYASFFFLFFAKRTREQFWQLLRVKA